MIKRKYRWVVIIASIVLIYIQCINFEYTIDDQKLITDVVSGKIDTWNSLTKLTQQLYNNRDFRPATMFVFGLENIITGKLNSKISHGINILLFILIVFLLYNLLSKVFLFKDSDKLVYLSVLIFACHPLCVEIVASVKSRDGLLSMLFSILSITFFYKAIKQQGLLNYFLGGLFFLLGILSKLDTLGILLFIPFLYFMENGFKKEHLKKAARIVFYLIILLVVFSKLKNGTIERADENSNLGLATFTENNIIDKRGILNNIAFAAKTNIIYLTKILFPLNLRYYYGYAHYQLNTFFTVQGVVFTLVSLLLIYLIIKFKSVNKKFIYIAFAGYLSFMLYASNFIVAVAGIVADRYIFIALPWFILFTLLVANDLIPIKYKENINIISYLIVILLITTSYYRASAWKNNLTLIERDAPHLSKSYEAMRIAANVYKNASEKSTSALLKEKYLDKAIDCSKKANLIYPNNIVMNLYEGSYHFSNNDIPKAIESFDKAWNVDSNNVNVNTFLGDSYYTLSDLKKALKYYLIAFKNSPDDYVLINNIGTVYYELGEKSNSLDFSKEIIKNDSTNVAGWENLGYFYLSEKDSIKAGLYFEKALKKGMPESMIPVSAKKFIHK